MNPMQIIQLLQGGGPNAIMQFINSNPQFKEIQPLIQNLQGKSIEEAEKYVRNYCATQNIDINPYISLAKQFNLPL